MHQTATEIGREGELIVSILLERAGVRTAIVNFPGVDIVCVTKSGISFTVEVKSRTRRQDDSSKYTFRNKSKGVSDWIAYVALDSQIVLFESGADPVSHRSIPANDFCAEAMQETINRMLEAYAA